MIFQINNLLHLLFRFLLDVPKLVQHLILLIYLTLLFAQHLIQGLDLVLEEELDVLYLLIYRANCHVLLLLVKHVVQDCARHSLCLLISWRAI
jgi:hypothetical protein